MENKRKLSSNKLSEKQLAINKELYLRNYIAMGMENGRIRAYNVKYTTQWTLSFFLSSTNMISFSDDNIYIYTSHH